jgi:hypothetical protein
MERSAKWLLIVVLLATCSSKHSFDHKFFKAGESHGILDNKKINEASGLASSIKNPGMLWTHNDSGNSAEIFLIDSEAKCKATIQFPNLKNRDWEDIAVGPGPNKNESYVFIGEIGDNYSQYDFKYIYRLKEPVLRTEKKSFETEITEVDSIKFNLSDGARDTEALMVDPLTRDIYIFSKREKEIGLYILPFPQSTTEVITAQFILRLPYTQINAADISSDGKEVLIKNYHQVYYWFKENDNESLKELLNGKPAFLPYVTEPQGEAITFDRSGKGYYTLSEEIKNKKPHLMYYQRKVK